jgi:hypothetical protein
VPHGKVSRHDTARDVSRLAGGLYYPSSPAIAAKTLEKALWDLWDEAALEAAVEVLEADPQFAEYEAWEEVALAATVDAYDAGER